MRILSRSLSLAFLASSQARLLAGGMADWMAMPPPWILGSCRTRCCPGNRWSCRFEKRPISACLPACPPPLSRPRCQPTRNKRLPFETPLLLRLLDIVPLTQSPPPPLLPQEGHLCQRRTQRSRCVMLFERCHETSEQSRSLVATFKNPYEGFASGTDGPAGRGSSNRSPVRTGDTVSLSLMAKLLMASLFMIHHLLIL